MEKNQKNKTADLLERAIDIAERAHKCYRIGLIEDLEIKIDINSEDDYSVEVRVDAYRDSEKRWRVEERSYREEQTPPTGDPDDLANFLQKLIEERKAQLEDELEILEG